MVYSVPMMIHVGLFASVLGLWVSSFLYRKKRAKTKLVCPLRSNCDKVIGSRFGTTFGISNDILGIMYYIVMGALYSLMLVIPSFASAWVLYGVLVFTVF